MSIRVGKIYKVITSQGNECYVGSTFNTLRDRFLRHKKSYKEWIAGKAGNCSIYDLFEKYGVESCKIILIKNYEVYAESVKDKNHLSVYETLWIKKLKSVNKIEPCGGLLRKQYLKHYNKSNKEAHSQYHKQYYELNKEAISQKNKQYYESNKEAISNHQKLYRNQNKQSINENGKTKITCECGSIVSKSSLTGHRKSNKHQAFIQSQA